MCCQTGFMMKWVILMTKVAVYGGGIIAMTLAMVLKKHGIEVELWRPPLKTPISETKRVFALNASSMTFLKELGILEKTISAHIAPVRRMFVWDEKTGAQIEFHASDLGQANVAHIVEEPFLWQKTFVAFEKNAIPIVELDDPIVAQSKNGEWRFKNHVVDFLCISDGARSAMRQYLQVPCAQESYQQTAIVAQVKMSQPHGNTAFQVFGEHGPLAFLPLHEKHTYSIVWSLDDLIAKQYLLLDKIDFHKQLEQALGGHLGHVEHIEGVQSYPLRMLHAKQYYASNWLLVGDAAHQFHPLAGLGLNVGLSDVKLLMKCLEENPKRFFCSIMLGRYQRERRAILIPLIVGMKMIKNCFSLSFLPWVKFRSIGMDLLNHQSWIKKMMVSWIQDV